MRQYQFLSDFWSNEWKLNWLQIDWCPGGRRFASLNFGGANLRTEATLHKRPAKLSAILTARAWDTSKIVGPNTC